jgi:organic hydroperoxide reductase OsmC/OhrA
MASKLHAYQVSLTWTGNRGLGTAAYGAYGRDHLISAGAKPPIAGSSDPSFRGDPACWNPEELLVASISACHQLWYMHLCAVAGIAVVSYADAAEGIMEEDESGSGQFVRVTLRPRVVLKPDDDIATAARLHHEAHQKCFIANSVNFPVHCEPEFAQTVTGNTVLGGTAGQP